MPGFRTGRPDVSTGGGSTPEPPTPAGALYLFDARYPAGVLASLPDQTRVTSWSNLGTAGGTVAQTAANLGPLMRNGVTPSGKPALHFDGVKNTLSFGNPLAWVQQTGVFHIVAVHRKAHRLGQVALLANMNGNNLLSTTPGWFLANWDGGVRAWIGRNSSTGAALYTGGPSWLQNTWAALEWASDATNIYTAVSLSAAHVTTAFVNPVNASGTPPFDAKIGCFTVDASNSYGWHSGDLAALYIWDRKLSVGERAQLATYVSTIWGVT